MMPQMALANCPTREGNVCSHQLSVLNKGEVRLTGDRHTSFGDV